MRIQNRTMLTRGRVERKYIEYDQHYLTISLSYSIACPDYPNCDGACVKQQNDYYDEWPVSEAAYNSVTYGEHITHEELYGRADDRI